MSFPINCLPVFLSGPKSDSDSSDDSSDSSDNAPDFGASGDGEGGEKPKALKGDDGIIHLLTEILHALKGGAGPGADPLGGPEAGGPITDLPDLGAPDKGEGLPAPGGPMGAGPGGPALPPPVKPKAPLGGPAFAKVNPSTKVVHAVRSDVAPGVKTAAIVAEAEANFPTHKVAKVQRRGSAIINESKVDDLVAAGLAVVTLVKK